MRVKPSLIVKIFKETNSASKTASLLGIHRSTVYRWVKRGRSMYRTHIVLKYKGLKRLSTKPKTIHYSLNTSQKQEILSLRIKKGYTTIKLKKILNISVSEKTIHRFLKKQGLINEYGNHRRPRYQKTTHMHLKNTTNVGFLQMDVKYITPELSGLPWTCFEYAVIDIYSRYKEAVILNHLDEDGSISALLEILPKLPFKPVFIQTDNGLEFQRRFHQFTQQLNLKHHYVHKRTPNENAVIERSFRTDEEEFFFMMEKIPQNYDQLREYFARYLKEYNYDRPHLGINLKTPFEVVANVMSN